MRTSRVGLLALTLSSGLVAGFSSPAGAVAPIDQPVRPSAAAAEPTAVGDDLPHPLEAKRRELREAGLTAVLKGEATPEQRGGSTVVKVGEQSGNAAGSKAEGARAPRAVGSADSADGADKVDQYVELEREGTDRIFVVLAEFGNERDPRFPDKDIDPATPGPTTFEGPLHNKIPEPDRAVDNSTVWQDNYSAKHYRELYFGKGGSTESVKTYYERQSSGRYSVDGTVTDWVKVKYNEARYGRSNDPNEGAAGDDPNVCGGAVCSSTWNLVDDAVDQWAADRAKAGRTKAQIKAELATFDKQDRYDFDGDGDFSEPDGYIDHFQIVHAGGDQADGDPTQGEDAIWSHRWYAFGTDVGNTGPAQNKLGGAEIGDLGTWVGDYTIQPENGGLSVFVHEYGHDLGLPDHYDTAGGGDNGVDWWTLMAQSRVSGRGEPLGVRAADLSAWDKLQLGWLDYEIAVAGQSRTLDLGPHEYNSAKPQAVAVVLPDKQVTSDLGAPYAGTKQWWSGSGDNLSNTLTRPVDLSAATTAELSMKARYEIEAEYDYLYVQSSTDGGTTWSPLDGTVDGAPFVRDASGTPAISGSSAGAWRDVRVPLTALKGSKPQVRFLYRTDGGVAPAGFFADDITLTVNGAVVLQDGAENGAAGWTSDGFSTVGQTTTNAFDNFYLASNRSYVSYDKYLRTGPYNFGFAPERPDYVEHFPYQEGLLVSYWDTSQADNNTSEHPGEGLILPVDSRPERIYNLQGQPWRGRIQIYDAPFSLKKDDSFTLHVNGQPSYVRGQAAQPVFDDRTSYWRPVLPNVGVKVPNAGVRMRVTKQDGTSMTVRLTSTTPAT